MSRSRPWTAEPRTRGFTLIEMVVVVMIVGILASAAMPLAALHKRRSQEAELRQGLRTLRMALDEHKKAWEAGRIRKKVDDSGYPPNLEVLVQGVPQDPQKFLSAGQQATQKLAVLPSRSSGAPTAGR